MTKTDPFTKQTFKPKRKNQVYATRQNRINANNQKALLEKKAKEFIDKPLQQNHRVLMQLLKAEEVKTFSKEYLAGKGYNFSILSHYEKYGEKNCPALYNFILVDLGTNSSTITIYRKHDTTFSN